jgi:hypothetical protein
MNIAIIEFKKEEEVVVSISTRINAKPKTNPPYHRHCHRKPQDFSLNF